VAPIPQGDVGAAESKTSTGDLERRPAAAAGGAAAAGDDAQFTPL
jgi:hypothetical protein